MPFTTSRVEALPALRTDHQSAATAVLAHDVGLRRKAVAHICYITKIDCGIPNDLDRKVVLAQGLFVGLAFNRTSYSKGPILAVPDGKIRFCCWTAVRTSCGASPFDCHQPWIQIDHDLALLPAIKERDYGPRHCDQLGPQEILSEVVQLLLRESVSGPGPSAEWARSKRYSDDQGR